MKNFKDVASITCRPTEDGEYRCELFRFKGKSTYVHTKRLVVRKPGSIYATIGKTITRLGRHGRCVLDDELLTCTGKWD